jgi:hypothetical protein
MADEVKKAIQRSLELFVEAVERTSNLEIVCEEEVEGKDLLVVENSEVAEDIEGHQCTVDVSEIFAVIKDCRTAQQFIDVINCDRGPIVLNGITRIVGYYSRVNNWNKSKIGELRDRKSKNYALSGQHAVHEEARDKAVNALS